MKTTAKPKTTTPTLPRAALDAPTVLARARVLAWRMGAAVDADALAAVGAGRHGKAGRAFAADVLEAVEAGVDLDAAIVAALTSEWQVMR